MINWNKYFDHIYIINLASSVKRRKTIQNELRRVGINIYDSFVTWKYTIKNPFYTILYNSDVVFKDSEHITQDTFNCSFAHYEVWQEALSLGYKRILIIEDDLIFIKDLDYIQKALDNMPTNELILFDYFYSMHNTEYESMLISGNYNGLYSAFIQNIIGASCYSVDTKAMLLFCSIQENIKFFPTDFVFNNDLNIGQEYYSEINIDKCLLVNRLGIQYSSIEKFNEQYKLCNDIDLNKYNIEIVSNY